MLTVLPVVVLCVVPVVVDTGVDVLPDVVVTGVEVDPNEREISNMFSLCCLPFGQSFNFHLKCNKFMLIVMPILMINTTQASSMITK